MAYVVVIKRKGSAIELTYGSYKTKEEAIKARRIAGQEVPARIVRVTKRTYPKEVKPR